MRVLVTGGAGYIGSVVVPRLLEIGDDITVFDKLYFGDAGLADVRDRLHLSSGDVRALDPAVLDGVDAVVHLAGLSNDPSADFNPTANATINAMGTEELARAAREAGIRRFVFVSTCSVYYTRGPSDDLKTEDTPVAPTAFYSQGKWLAERKLLELAAPGFTPVVLRLGTVFGLSPRMRYDLVVNTFVRDAWQHGRLTVHAGGEVWRPLVHIKDVADAILTALYAPKANVHGEVFNIVHKNYWIQSLAHWVKKVLEGKAKVEIDIDYAGQAEARGYRVSMDKAQTRLGFRADRGITAAVLEMWEALERGRFTDFENPIYYNIRWMKNLPEW
jgi:nucleoside-diphosphate-sugar epimerase